MGSRQKTQVRKPIDEVSYIHRNNGVCICSYHCIHKHELPEYLKVVYFSYTNSSL